MIPFSVAGTAVVLGIYLVSSVDLVRKRAECRRSIEVIVYFGIIWYGITNLSLLATYQDPHHLYLPAIGPCIATAFMIAPACTGSSNRTGDIRLLFAVFLVILCGTRLWNEDMQWARKVEQSSSLRLSQRSRSQVWL
jgi:hypothetical protein